MVSIHMFTDQPALADSEPVDWQLDIEAILRPGPCGSGTLVLITWNFFSSENIREDH